SRKQEIERLQKEVNVWKTLNEARIEMGYPPIEHGDVVLNATYTQYLAQKEQADQMGDEQGMPGEEGDANAQDEEDQNMPESNMEDFASQINAAIDEADQESGESKKDAEKQGKEDDKKAKEAAAKKDEAKKSEEPLV